MTFEEAKNFLTETAGKPIVLKLDAMYELLNRLDNPQEHLQFVHIAGTNGKGSTVSFVSSILQEAGYTVGRYSSPRVFEYTEFVQVNGANITREAFTRYVRKIKEVVEQMEAEGLHSPSMFEMETVVGFMYFLEMECDVVVMECGMGGAGDATNVVENILCNIITPIGLDHTAFLGDTLEAITEVKAGIIKNRAPVCVGRQLKRSFNVLQQVCNRIGAPLITIDDSRLKVYEEMEYAEDGAPMIHFDYKYLKDVKIRLVGRYQIDNAMLAIEAAKVLDDWGLNVPVNAILSGLAKATCPGRFETIAKDPQIIIDGAHNPHGIEQLKRSVEYYFGNKRLIGVMGVLADKAFDEECEMLAPVFDKFFTVTPPDNPRALEAEKLAETLEEFHDDVTACESVEAGVNAAIADAKKDDVIVIFGSLSYLAVAKKAVKKAMKNRD